MPESETHVEPHKFVGDTVDLVKQFMPEFRMSKGEQIMPMDYSDYLEIAKLVNKADGTVLKPAPLTVSSLAAFTRGIPDHDKIALTIGEPFLTNPGVKGGLDAPVYANTFLSPQGDLVINYITFYGADTGKMVLGVKRVGSHMSDIEHISVVISSESPHVLKRVYYSAHTSDEGKWVDGPNVPVNDEGRIVVYVSKGSHGLYPEPGTYIRFYGFGNDVADGLGHVWTPQQVVEISDDMTVFNGNIGLEHVRNFGDGQAWYTDVDRNEGGRSPYHLNNGEFTIMIVLLFVVVGYAAKRHFGS